ncbi:hypothetical protein J2S74_001391 [Evansella vedderi]|uniref:Sin domain-containing protein n=1 Tax=Evansella vedderi TaxID=38282 RepID=A0ABT9ZU66_9BACI|nr:anti-repressor SinI family protein [Evansella vedderi]MDQ0254018.1 hypothetical protein [Evansella vedderi]
MEKVIKLKKPVVDEEWVQLLEEARSLGIKPEEIRLFLARNEAQSKVR